MDRYQPRATVRVALTATALAGAVVVPSGATRIEGRLVGHDDAPMIKAHVEVFRPVRESVIDIVEVGEDGRYAIEFSAAGLVVARLAGVGHSPISLPLVVDPDETIELNARMATYDYADSLSDVHIIGDFNRWSYDFTPKLKPDFGGTYFSEFKAEQELVAYQVLDIVPGRAVNGSDAVDYLYDGGGDYKSVIRVYDGMATITLDPARLHRSDAPERIDLPERHQLALAMRPIYERTSDRLDRFLAAVERTRRVSRPITDFTGGILAELDGLIEAARAETDPELRPVRHMEALQVVRMVQTPPDEAFIRETLEENPPSSPYWSLTPELMGFVIKYTGGYPDRKDLLDAFIGQSPDPEIRRIALLRGVNYAIDLGDDVTAAGYRAQLEKEFPTSSETQVAEKRTDATTVVKGSPIPAFSMASLDDPDVILDNETFAGKTYLIDFWATWCAPCIREMGSLHEVYDTYKDRGFDILSISFDQKADVIPPFRVKWPMPWHHAYAENAFQSDLAKTFGVISIPKPILVGADGTVLAVGNDLRGHNLEHTLADAFGVDAH